MKKLKHIFAGVIFTFAIGLTLNCQVKAETTIDLNGNKIEVATWIKQTSVKDGSYKIISSEMPFSNNFSALFRSETINAGFKHFKTPSTF